MVLGAATLFSLAGLIIRHMEGAGPWAILFWRSIGMVPVLATYVAWKAGGDGLPGTFRRSGLTGLIGAVALVLAFGGGVFALSTTTIANACFLLSATPVFAAIIGRLVLRERVRPRTWAAIGIAAVGMFLTVREGLAIGQLPGNLAAVLSALGMAIFTATLRWGKRGNMMPTVLLGAILTAMAAAGAAFLADEPLLVSAHDMFLSVMMGAVLISFGLFLYTAGSKAISAAEITLLNLLEILLAPLWVWLFLSETPTGGTLIGGAVIVCAVLSISASGSRTKRSTSISAL